ncbi:MAG: ptsH [bacterium]|nr:MAG: ptsH [bacterium]
MPEREVEIINRLGLHARASAKLTQTAGRFACEVWLSRNGRRVLAAARGTQIRLETHGPDEDAAMSALVELIEDKFGEGE